MSDCTIPLKQCKRCKQFLPATAEYFHRVRKHYLQSYCKPCVTVLARERRQRNGAVPRLVAEKPGHKICSICRRELPATTEYFYKDRGGRFGLGGKCKECRSGEYQERRDYYIEYHRLHKVARNRRVSERNREMRTERRRAHKAWRDKNPFKARAVTQRRKSRQKQVPHTLTEQDWQFALDYFGGCCAVCGRPPGLWHFLAHDHWIPLTKGGATTQDNIVPLCHSKTDGVDGCNNLKHNKHPDEWLIYKFGKRKARLISNRIQSYFSEVRKRGQ